MPPNNPQSITARPAGDPGQRQVLFQPQERVVDTYAAPSQDTALNGLIEGLKSFNPALNQYVNLQNQKDATAAFKEGTAQGQLADAGLTDAQPGGIKVPPPPDNLKIDPAFNDTFAAGYRNSVGAKIGNQVQTDILSAYAQHKNTDGFDPEQFLHEQVASHTAGITDPAIVDQVSKSVATTADHVRQDYAQVQLQRLKETAVGNLSAVADGVLDPSKPLSQMWDGVQKVLEPMRGQMGMMTRPEMADMLLDKINNLSTQAGGRPELFDLFSQFKDPTTGLTLQQMNPKIQTEATRLQHRATEEQNQRIEQGQQTDFFKKTVADEDAASQGKEPDINDFVNRIGPLNQFKTASAALGEYRRLQGMADKAQGDAQAVQAVGNGTAWALDKKTAQGALDTAQQPDVNTLMQVVSSASAGDPSQLPQVQQAIKSITDITGRSGRSDLANTNLKALIDGTVNAVPPKDGQPSSQFKLAAALYAGLPDQLRSLYFDEKASALFGSYSKDRSAGVDDNTAYATAYKSATPEAQKFAKELTSNPEWKANVTKQVSGLTTDWYQKIPVVGRIFGGTPQNEQATSTWAQLQLREFYTRNPTASDSQAKDWIQNQVKTNFVYDPVNKVDLQVPPNQASDQTAEAMKSYLEKAREQYGEDANPGLIYGKDGKYTLAAFINGAPVHKLADVTFDQIIQQNASTKVLSSDERSAMAGLQSKLNSGSATTQDLIDNAQLLAKASNLRQLNDTTQGQIAKVRESAFNGAMDNVFNFPTAPASFAGLSGSRLTGQGSKIQVNQAGNFLGSGNYAAALTTMGEGLVLKATPDPNPKAGNNIGYGYNLNANSATIGEDFRRAGIPATSIDGIKNGTVQITQEQAARLLEVSLPRYTDRAKQAVEAASPGLWGMINQNQRAALTDVAYQVGDVSQFHKAIGALARKDIPAFNDALKVTYAGKDGNRIEDSRRNNLRSLMINGPIAFLQGIKEAARTSN
jgi:GH24 family phage-related lysozyme (muramidase)